MLRINHFTVITFIASILVSCGEKEMDASMLWGKTDYYADFLFKDYEPVKMTKTICFETNEDANGRVGNVKFGLYKKTEDESYIPVKDEIRLYKNDVLCENNILLITPEDHEVQLGIEFTPEAEEGVHKWFLKVLDNGGFDRINEYATEEDSLPLLLEWKAEKNEVMNPLKRNIIGASVTIIVLAILWYFISRFIIWRSVPFSKIYITYPNQDYHTIRMNGKYQLVCSNNKHAKDSILSVIFKGNKQYEYNEFWSHPIIIERGRNAKSIRISKLGDFILNGDKIRKQPFEIIDLEGNKVIIETT